MNTAMDDLIERFKGEAVERLGRIDELLNDGDVSEPAQTRCGLIREEAHKLKGAAGILGFPDMKDRAAALEDASAECAETSGDDMYKYLHPLAVALRASIPA